MNYNFASYAHHIIIEGTEYKVYGIQAYCQNNLVAELPDVSPDLAEINDIIYLCTEYQLDPIHLRDFIEDYIDYIG